MSYQLRLLKILFFLAAVHSHTVQANPAEEADETDDLSTAKPPHQPLAAFYQKKSPFSLRHDPTRKRSIFFPQLVSYFLPGFDQVWERQYDSALIYAATGTVGLVYANYRAQQLGAANLRTQNNNAYGSKDNYYRGYTLGNEIYQVAGGLSTYHSFRSAVRSRQNSGDFAFLKEEESLSEIMISPFRVDYLARPTTWIPLSIGVLLAYLQNTPSALAQSDMRSTPLKSSDYFYSAASGYEAGVSEESVFRGWLLPAARYGMDSELLANLTQATVFGLAHLGTVKVPIIQAVFGYYLGYLTIHNNWTISEGVFIHSWWDFISFLATYSSQDKNSPQKIKQPKFLLLPLEWHF